MTKQRIIFITGASGSGKTSVMKALEESLSNVKVDFYYFDSIGIPSFDEMIAECGSLESWQQKTTEKWVQRLALIKDKDVIFFEGQYNPEFVVSECESLKINNYRLICLDVSDEERMHRLSILRQQPELADENMLCWASVLRDKTISLGGSVIDTTGQSISEMVRVLQSLVNEK